MGPISRGNLFPSFLRQPILDDGTGRVSRNVGKEYSDTSANEDNSFRDHIR